MANLHTTNGRLESLFESSGDGGTPISIGDPLIIRYLHFRLFHRARGPQRLMISTFLKSGEEKSGAAEAINYFNPRTRFDDDGFFRLADFGGQHYGHPLCFYTKSYLGEAIRLTTRVMELDGLDRRTMNALRRGLGLLSSLPVLTQHLAWLSVLDAGLPLATRLLDALNRDDALVESHSLDLYGGPTSHRHLRPGRIVCIPGAEEDEFIAGEAWELARDNRLCERATGREYDRGSYFVLEILRQEAPAYEGFDHFQNAAELLSLTNRPDHPLEILDLGVRLARGLADQRILERIEEERVAGGASPERLRALFRLLSPRIQALCQPPRPPEQRMPGGA